MNTVQVVCQIFRLNPNEDMEAWIGVYVTTMILAIKYCRGEIRCYCNDASCINKGYMCKSSLDRCFSLMTPDGANNFRPFHGCAELLSGRLATACGQPEVDYVEHEATGSSGADHFRSRVVCCTDDMCNYNADGHMFPVPVGPTKVSDGRMQAHKTSSSDRKAPERKPPPRQGHHPTVHEDALRRDVWFRAAVIAVPIAGLVILVLLILLAVRLLRAEYVTKSSTNHSVPRIFKSPQRSTDYKHVAVSIADDRGDVRTVLAPSCESECVKVASSRECTRTKVWTDKEFNFTLETSKMHETFSPSSDCCKSNCECCCLTRDIALTKSSNDVIV